MSERLHTLHLPPGADPANTLVVADRWRWGAFVFPLLWALWNRHWVLVVPLALLGAVAPGLAAAGQTEAGLAFDLALRVGLACEAAGLVRLDRRLRGWRELAAIPARDETEAEWIWFGAPPEAVPHGAPR